MEMIDEPRRISSAIPTLLNSFFSFSGNSGPEYRLNREKMNPTARTDSDPCKFRYKFTRHSPPIINPNLLDTKPPSHLQRLAKIRGTFTGNLFTSLVTRNYRTFSNLIRLFIAIIRRPSVK